MDLKIEQKGTPRSKWTSKSNKKRPGEHAMVTPGAQKTSRDPKEISVGDQMGHLGTQKRPQRESRWAPRLPKGTKKDPKL